MRQPIVIIAMFPLANAVSLANFQDITSPLIPLGCQIAYDEIIPICTAMDFGDSGCSSDCQSSLLSVADTVTQACSNVDVSSNSLLGIIKSGGILAGVCANPSSTPTTISISSTPASMPTSTINTDTVNLPTASPGVIVTTSTSQSMTTTSSSSTTATSATTSSSASTISPSTFSTTQTTSSSVTSSSPIAFTSSTISMTGISTIMTTRSTSAVPAQTTASDSGNSGGGSPFDISSNEGGRLESASILALIIAAGAGLLLS